MRIADQHYVGRRQRTVKCDGRSITSISYSSHTEHCGKKVLTEEIRLVE